VIVGAIVAYPFVRDWSVLGTSYSTTIQHRPFIPVDAYELATGMALFRATADRLVAGTPGDRERLESLMEWTYENVRPQYAAPNRVVPDNYLDIVRRGHGYCDQSAHVFATLAYHAGYDSRLLFLRAPDGVSPHTVAEVEVDGSWILVDPWMGEIFVDTNGQLAGVEDLGVSATLAEGYRLIDARLDEGHFQRGTVFETFPYMSVPDVLGKVGRRLIGSRSDGPPPGPRTELGAARSTDGAAADASRSRPRPNRAQRRAQRADAVPPRSDDIRLMDTTRRAHLEGRFDEAIAGYRTLLQHALPGDMGESVRFFLGLALLRSGAASEAIEAFDAALDEAPESAWRPSVLYYRGEARLLGGDRNGAANDLRESGIPRDLHRLASLQAGA